MYKPNCFIIHCQSNMHAGSGDTNYGIIDKMIQRDSVTQLPCVYASSLKGAFREFFTEGPEKEILSGLADGIFGKKISQESEGVDNSKGNTIFHEAQIIGLPVRSNQRPYFMATSKIVLENFIEKSIMLGLNFPSIEAEILSLPNVTSGSPMIIGSEVNELIIEDYENVGSTPVTITALVGLLGNNIVLMHHDDFKDACSNYNLPVIARNNLENGESKNLWYEQILPHQSRLVFYTVSIGEDRYSANINSKIVQIGANSSLGYGYCKIIKL